MTTFLRCSAAEYHADKLTEKPALSNSVLSVLLRETPRKAWFSHPRLNPKYQEAHDDKFDLGTVAHAQLLEDDETRLVVVEADDWRTKAAKEAREAARTAGKVALLARHADQVRDMVSAARAYVMDSEIAPYWSNAESELVALAEIDGMQCKARLDRITLDRSVIFDYKTTDNVSPEVFSRQIIRMGYHWQDAFYRIVSGAGKFVFLAQSVEPPYECSLHGCDPALQEISEFQVREGIAAWKRCLQSNSWPSYGPRIHWATPTNWQMSEYERSIQEAA